MSLEGQLEITLKRRDGCVAGVAVDTSRPDVARAMLQGRHRTEVIAALPRLFAICGRSQAVTGELACAAAAGVAAAAAPLARAGAAVAAEIVRECTWRMLLDWPRRLGEAAGDAAVAAARAALAWQPDMPTAMDQGPDRPHAVRAAAIAQAVFAMPADDWLALDSATEIDRWLGAGRTPAARFLRRVRDDAAPGAPRATGDEAGVAPATPLLPAADHGRWIGELAAACDADAAFAQRPHWRGAAAETGALARCRSDALIAALHARADAPVLLRLLARMRELARLLDGRTSAAVGATALPAGGGVAWAETARGLLVHRVHLDGERVSAYRIVAPTEWNFHPAGVLAHELVGLSGADSDQIKARAEILVHALDPCVGCRIEIVDA